jgi:NDP-sugar pyrophosphorylase family protein
MTRNRKFTTSPQSVDGESGCTDELVTIILLSEKSGHRMKSYGPTPLIKVGNRTLLDRQIEAIKRTFRNFELIICGGFDCDKVTQFVRDNYRHENIRIVENQIYHHSNCCESARLGVNNTTNDRVLLCNGGLTLDYNTLSLLEHDRSCIVIEKQNPSSELEIGVTIGDDGCAEYFCFGLSNIWSEIVYLSGLETIEFFRRTISSIEYKNKFIFEALNDLVSAKYSLSVIENEKTPISKINDIKTYHKVRKIYEGTSTKLRNN